VQKSKAGASQGGLTEEIKQNLQWYVHGYIEYKAENTKKAGTTF